VPRVYSSPAFASPVRSRQLTRSNRQEQKEVVLTSPSHHHHHRPRYNAGNSAAATTTSSSSAPVPSLEQKEEGNRLSSASSSSPPAPTQDFCSGVYNTRGGDNRIDQHARRPPQPGVNAYTALNRVTVSPTPRRYRSLHALFVIGSQTTCARLYGRSNYDSLKVAWLLQALLVTDRHTYCSSASKEPLQLDNYYNNYYNPEH
jgi:hypothetical protein